MHCKKCGREMKDGDIFCTFCGTKQVTEESEMINEEKNMNSSSNGTEILIDKKTLTNWIIKIGFLILIFILYSLSKAEMFELSDYYQMTISELVNNTKLFLNEADSTSMQFFYECFSGSILLYFAASAFAFFDKNGMAGLCTVLAFAGTVIGILGILNGIMTITQATGFASIMPMIKESLWLYVGMNVVVLGYAIKYI